MNQETVKQRKRANLHTPVTRQELETKGSMVARRLMVMAWPDTAQSILKRINVSAFAFSAEHGIITVNMDIFSRDVERSVGRSELPFTTVSILLSEKEDGSSSVLSSTIIYRDPQQYGGEVVKTLKEAYSRMTKLLH